ncbi:BrnT family toxin [Psychrobacter sp. I-STPA10]|uniref:BrnT family toxin n=1 Tax=Psychrobacter sp. I-STPA10 TaxID=2585769 RepID=UPI001E517613|nr:BrnT family toxin [Psychrobacter sp. I-STPA10]
MRKHGIAFEDIKGVFYDPFCLRQPDDRFDYGEDRWQAIGSIYGVTIVFVGYTYRDDDNIEVIRIISARRATSKERRFYEHG